MANNSSFPAGATLYAQMEESTRLEEVIKPNLAKLGYAHEKGAATNG